MAERRGALVGPLAPVRAGQLRRAASRAGALSASSPTHPGHRPDARSRRPLRRCRGRRLRRGDSPWPGRRHPAGRQAPRHQPPHARRLAGLSRAPRRAGTRLPTSQAHRGILYANRDADWRFARPDGVDRRAPTRRAARQQRPSDARRRAAPGSASRCCRRFFVHADVATGRAWSAIDIGCAAEGAELHVAYPRERSASAKIAALTEPQGLVRRSALLGLAAERSRRATFGLGSHSGIRPDRLRRFDLAGRP